MAFFGTAPRVFVPHYDATGLTARVLSRRSRSCRVSVASRPLQGGVVDDTWPCGDAATVSNPRWASTPIAISRCPRLATQPPRHRSVCANAPSVEHLGATTGAARTEVVVVPILARSSQHLESPERRIRLSREASSPALIRRSTAAVLVGLAAIADQRSRLAVIVAVRSG